MPSIFQNMFTQEWIYQLIVSFLIFSISLTVHEYAHAFVADKLGDPTARYMGRLTFNPFAHLDILGTIAILIIGVGWAKPVPVNSRNLKNPKRDMILISIAGPVANVLLSLVVMILYKLLSVLYGVTLIGALVPVVWVLVTLTLRNITLAIFNLLPIPPLDGSRLLTWLLPGKAYYSLMRYEQVIMIAVMLLIFSGLLDWPLTYLTNTIFKLLDLLTFFIPA